MIKWALSATLFVIFGCGGSKGSQAPDEQQALPAAAPPKQPSSDAVTQQYTVPAPHPIKAGDSVLEGKLRVLATEIVTAPKSCQVVLENISSDSVSTTFSVRWFDPKGRYLTNGKEWWQPLAIAAGKKVLIKANAPASWANDFTVEFKAPR